MYPCSQVVNQFIEADFRTLTWKVFCFAFGSMAACQNTRKIPQIGRNHWIKSARVFLGKTSERVRAKSWCTPGAETAINDVFSRKK